MFVKSHSKTRFQGISGGKPSENKKRSLFSKNLHTDGAASPHGRRITDQQTKKNKLPAFTPWKVVLASFLIGICGIFYIGHVFSTQQALMEVNQLENEYNKAKRLYHEQRLVYDRMTGPKEIYQQARSQGFVNAGPADQIIYITK
ncbi:MAG: hypothetical protein JJU13_15395 [Balneolaceae bacterium]|jgi:hypothetical protein|nr:hypothetical protein [Balneolaceae bacterium]